MRFFKRYLLPTELLVNRLRGGTAMQGGQDVLKVELKRLEWETKRNEVIHLLALLLITCILFVKSLQLSAMQVLLILGASRMRWDFVQSDSRGERCRACAFTRLWSRLAPRNYPCRSVRSLSAAS